MKRLMMVLVPLILILACFTTGAEAGGGMTGEAVQCIVTTGDMVRAEKSNLVKYPVKAKADFTVDTSDARHAITGFGGAFNEQGWATLCALDEGERQRVLSSLFAADEANLSYGRIPIGASDYALERYTLAPVKDDFGMENFTLERDRKYLIPYIKAAQGIRPDIKLWASAWSPPVWMKDNNDYEGGNFIDDARYYRAYALYLARFAEEYAKLGMGITAIAVQNEPTVVTGYPNGGWKPEQFRAFIRDFMGPVFAERGIASGIMLGTFNDARYGTFAKTVLDDAVAKRYVDIIGLQWDGDMQIADILKRHPGIPIMQTETDCGNWHWKSGFKPDRAPNDFKYAAYTWARMKSYLSGGAESYMLWNIILDQDGKNIDKIKKWPQNSAIVVNTITKEVTYTPMFRAFEHFSRYLPAGSKYVATRGSYAGAVGFVTPEGNIVVELMNDGAKARTVTGKIDGKLYSVEMPPESFMTLTIRQ